MGPYRSVIRAVGITDLEKNGWIAVCRVGKFAGSRKPSLYRLTMHASEVEGLPKTEEFERVRNPARPGRKKDLTGSNKTAYKSLLKPQQVLVETATEQTSQKTSATRMPLTLGKKELFPPQSPSSQLSQEPPRHSYYQHPLLPARVRAMDERRRKWLTDGAMVEAFEPDD